MVIAAQLLDQQPPVLGPLRAAAPRQLPKEGGGPPRVTEEREMMRQGGQEAGSEEPSARATAVHARVGGLGGVGGVGEVGRTCISDPPLPPPFSSAEN